MINNLIDNNEKKSLIIIQYYNITLSLCVCITISNIIILCLIYKYYTCNHIILRILACYCLRILQYNDIYLLIYLYDHYNIIMIFINIIIHRHETNIL